jgi:Leucine-rich repeat (LRR) protein
MQIPIIEIKIVNLMDIEEIIDLPYKLQVLSIELTTLERLTIPEYCKNIKVIEIKHSNLTYISDIDFLTNLHKLIIEHSHLTKIPEKVLKLDICESIDIKKEIKNLFVYHFKEKILSKKKEKQLTEN